MLQRIRNEFKKENYLIPIIKPQKSSKEMAIDIYF